MGVTVQQGLSATNRVASTTDNTLPRFDGTAGALQTSGIVVDDSNNTSGVGTLACGAITTTGALILQNGAASGSARVGADVNAGTITNNTRKIARVTAPPYANANSNSLLFGADNDVGGNSIAFGAYPGFSVAGAGTLYFGTNPDPATTGGTVRLQINTGLFHPSATGGDKGNNTINFGAVYDDNVLLTCVPMQEEFLKNGAVNLAKWDALVPDQIVPASSKEVPVTYTRTEQVRVPVVEEVDGRLVRRFEVQDRQTEEPFVWADPVYDEAGALVDVVETPVFDVVETPEQVIPRIHHTAHLFAAMLDEGFDPRDPAQYIAKLKADQALPGMPTQANWEHNSLSSGEMVSRLWLATEMLAIVVMNLHERVAALEGMARG